MKNRSLVLVSILTPRYLISEWCTKEVAEFCKSAEQSVATGDLATRTHSEQLPQQAFIEALHQDAKAQFGADLAND